MKVLVVYYSKFGHTLELARAAEQGAAVVTGVEVRRCRVQEFPDDLDEIKANAYAAEVWESHKDIPVCTLDDLRDADGLIFASPTRFGNMIAQMKRLFDLMAGLWLEGAMEGKPAGVITSTSTTHGGQESTLLTMSVPLLHLGMLVVGVPYSTPGMLHTEGRGGTPYGPTTVAGPKNQLEVRPEDLDIAGALGRRVAEIAVRLRGS